MTGFGTYLDVYVFLRKGDLKDYKRLHQAILDSCSLEISQEDSEKILNFTRSLTVNLNSRWTTAHRVQKTFMKKNMNWLESKIKWAECESGENSKIFEKTKNLKHHSTEEEAAVTCIASTSKGTLLDYPEVELTSAFLTKLKSNGKEGLARIIDHLLQNPDKVEAVEFFLLMNEKKETSQEDQEIIEVDEEIIEAEEEAPGSVPDPNV